MRLTELSKEDLIRVVQCFLVGNVAAKNTPIVVDDNTLRITQPLMDPNSLAQLFNDEPPFESIDIDISFCEPGTWIVTMTGDKANTIFHLK